MNLQDLEVVRCKRGEAVEAFYIGPRLEQLRDLARALRVVPIGDLAVVLLAVRIAQAGDGIDGLPAGDVDMKAPNLPSARLRELRSAELDRLRRFVDGADVAHQKLRDRISGELERRQQNHGRYAVEGYVPEPVDQAPELKAFAAEWRGMAHEYGLYAREGELSAADVRAAIVSRVAALTRVLQARRGEEEPAALKSLRRDASKLRGQAGELHTVLERARATYRLVGGADAETDVRRAAAGLEQILAGLRDLQGKAFDVFAVTL